MWHIGRMKKIIRKRRKGDANQIAHSILQDVIALTEQPADAPMPTPKNPAAVALGRLGGLKGGIARREALSAKRKTQIARQAAVARWRKRTD